MKRPTGIILYQGPSQIDAAQIVVIATGIGTSSKNSKTGGMIQTHILRADMLPMAAIHSGKDVSICGDCIHRGDGKTGAGRTCYVKVFQAQTGIYKAFLRGAYADYDPAAHDRYFEGKGVRFGSYGDPAAAPIDIWINLKKLAAYTTGYTHQWRHVSADWAALLMASADTIDDAHDAHAKGYRTFRVADDRMKGEVLCPASKEAGQKLQCADCRACAGVDGKRKGSIVIPLHGPNGKEKGRAELESRLIARAS